MRSLCLAVLGAVCASLASTVQAQEAPAAVETIDLATAIRKTLRTHPLRSVYEAQIEISRASHAAARSGFDHVVSSAIARSHDITPMSADGRDTSMTEQRNLQMGVSRLFPWGTTVTPYVSLSQMRSRYTGTLTQLYGTDTITGNVGGVNLGVTQPLLKGFGLRGTAGAARSAEVNVQATTLSAQHSMATLVFSTVQRYWELLAAIDRQRILVEAEQRALRILKETQVLVEADERPVADLQQLQASVADARARLARAKSAQFSAAQRLGQAMGLPSERLDAGKTTADLLPGVDLSEILVPIHPDVSIARALEQRLDLSAQMARVNSARILMESAQHNRLPSLDMQLGLGYAELAEGDDLEAFFDPLNKEVEGFNTSVSLTLALPVENRAARASAWSRTALHQSAKIQKSEIERGIHADVTIAVDGLQSSLATLAAAEDSVRYYEAAVRAERTKLREGMSTIINLVITQNQLTSAQIAQVDARLSLAYGLVALAYQTGQLPYEEAGITPELVDTLTKGRRDGNQ